MSTEQVIVAGKAGCAYCTQVKELRPYGRNGAWICFACAMEAREETERSFSKILEADTVVIDTREVRP